MGQALSNATVDNGGLLSIAGRDVNVTVHNPHVNAGQAISNELEILNWLSKINFRNMYLDNLSQRAPGTGSHFIQYHHFQKWVNGEGGVFWGTGMRGYLLVVH